MQRPAHRDEVSKTSLVSAHLKLIQESPDGTVDIGTDFTHSALSLQKHEQGVRQHDVGLLNISSQRRFPRPPYNYSSDKYVPGEDGTYAQNDQDIWLEQLASANGWLEPQAAKGFYLDLGAFNRSSVVTVQNLISSSVGKGSLLNLDQTWVFLSSVRTQLK